MPRSLPTPSDRPIPRCSLRGKPVADIVPAAARRTARSPDEVGRILAQAPLDAGFAGDLDAAAGATIDDL
ncbi:MAG: hypothetical protein M3Z33_00905 [Actinomycetota bacterium]|nr:hypothetical protein [Actinomycetota bacterium]